MFCSSSCTYCFCSPLRLLSSGRIWQLFRFPLLFAPCLYHFGLRNSERKSKEKAKGGEEKLVNWFILFRFDVFLNKLDRVYCGWMIEYQALCSPGLVDKSLSTVSQFNLFSPACVFFSTFFSSSSSQPTNRLRSHLQAHSFGCSLTLSNPISLALFVLPI